MTMDAMIVPQRPRLRPLSVVDMLDVAVRLYRGSFLKLVRMTASITLPLSALQLLVQVTLVLPMAGSDLISSGSGVPQMWLGQGLNMLLALLEMTVISNVLEPAIAWAVGQRYLDRPFRVGAAFKRAWQRLSVSLLIGLLYGAVSSGLLLFWIVPCIGWLGAPAVWAYVSVNMMVLRAPIVALEDGDVSTTLRHAWTLTRRGFWRAFGLVTALYAFTTALTLGPVLLASYLIVSMAGQVEVATAIGAGVGVLSGLITLPVQNIGVTLLYYDLRVRHEGYDLQVLAGIENEPERYVRAMTWFDRSDRKTLFILVGLMLGLILACVGLYMFLVMGSMLFFMGVSP